MKTTEKKVSHTPGPWKTIEEFEGWAVIRVDKKPMLGRSYICKEIDQGFDGGAADAKLIAAAPELLKALQAIEAAGELAILSGDNAIYKFAELAIANARDAIKKATE